MTSNQVFENCQLEKSHWIINHIVTTEYIIFGWICQVHLGFGLSASAQVPDKPALAWVACPGILHRS